MLNYRQVYSDHPALDWNVILIFLDGVSWYSEEHVSAKQETDQGADRVVDRAQVHEEGRWQHQYVHLYGLGPSDILTAII